MVNLDRDWRLSSVDVRDYDCEIIQKFNQFLVAVRDCKPLMMAWSNCRWDAYQFRNHQDAVAVAKKVDGIPMYFNPITGET